MSKSDVQHTRCSKCGQSLVSDNAGSGVRRDIRGKRGRVAGNGHCSVSNQKAASNTGGDIAGRNIAVAFDFIGGHFEGNAIVVEEKPLTISFEWGDKRRRIQISESEVIGNYPKNLEG